jgi:hypothetical protein
MGFIDYLLMDMSIKIFLRINATNISVPFQGYQFLFFIKHVAIIVKYD